MTRGSFWRREPAAALRGLANTGLPASVIDSLSRSNLLGQEHLTAHLEQLRHRELVGAGQPVRDESMVLTLGVTSSPVSPSPRVSARTSRPAS